MEKVADLLRAEQDRSPLAQALVAELNRIAAGGELPKPGPKLVVRSGRLAWPRSNGGRR